jgi:TolB protein
MNSDGSERSRLTDDDAEQFEAQWSPRGDLIAFVSQETTDTGDAKGFLEVIAPSGQGRQIMAEGDFALGEPLWSPDGTRIAFTRYTRLGRPSAVVIALFADGAPEIKVGRNLMTTDAAWSPDSKFLLLSDEGDLLRFRLRDGSLKRLTSGTAYDYGPDQRSL